MDRIEYEKGNCKLNKRKTIRIKAWIVMEVPKYVSCLSFIEWRISWLIGWKSFIKVWCTCDDLVEWCYMKNVDESVG